MYLNKNCRKSDWSNEIEVWTDSRILLPREFCCCCISLMVYSKIADGMPMSMMFLIILRANILVRGDAISKRLSSRNSMYGLATFDTSARGYVDVSATEVNSSTSLSTRRM